MARYELKAPCAGSLWMQSAAVGQSIEAGSPVAIMESMKMEIPLVAEEAGTVTMLLEAGTILEEGQIVAVVETRD